LLSANYGDKCKAGTTKGFLFLEQQRRKDNHAQEAGACTQARKKKNSKKKKRRIRTRYGETERQGAERGCLLGTAAHVRGQMWPHIGFSGAVKLKASRRGNESA